METNIREAKIQKEKELMVLEQVSYSIEQLKQKLETLIERFQSTDKGTEAVKLALTNWVDIKRVISLATCKFMFGHV